MANDENFGALVDMMMAESREPLLRSIICRKFDKR